MVTPQARSAEIKASGRARAIVPNDSPARQNQNGTGKRHDVGERVAGHGNEVRDFARLDSADGILNSKRARGVHGSASAVVLALMLSSLILDLRLAQNT